jgi:hypothetical protein
LVPKNGTAAHYRGLSELLLEALRLLAVLDDEFDFIGQDLLCNVASYAITIGVNLLVGDAETAIEFVLSLVIDAASFCTLEKNIAVFARERRRAYQFLDFLLSIEPLAEKTETAHGDPE